MKTACFVTGLKTNVRATRSHLWQNGRLKPDSSLKRYLPMTAHARRAQSHQGMPHLLLLATHWFCKCEGPHFGTQRAAKIMSAPRLIAKRLCSRNVRFKHKYINIYIYMLGYLPLVENSCFCRDFRFLARQGVTNALRTDNKTRNSMQNPANQRLNSTIPI